MDYTKLQNGSDIRGVAMEGIKGQHVNLTEQACRDIGRGFALWLRARLGKDTLRVAVGRDSRLSGPQLALWLMEAMAAEGLQVTDLGMASTPAMFMSTVTEGFAFDASVMITASHLPFNRNGYKFFTKDGGLEKQDIAAILALAGGSEHTGLPAGSIVTGSFMDTYAAQLRKKVQDAAGCEQPLAGMRIVVDAGNGAADSTARRSSSRSARIPRARATSTPTAPSPTTSRTRKTRPPCSRSWTRSRNRRPISASSLTPTSTARARSCPTGRSSTATASSP